jgi:flagellar hook-length control protein FliK
MTVPVMPNPTTGSLTPNVQNTGVMSNPQQASGRFGDAILALLSQLMGESSAQEPAMMAGSPVETSGKLGQVDLLAALQQGLIQQPLQDGAFPQWLQALQGNDDTADAGASLDQWLQALQDRSPGEYPDNALASLLQMLRGGNEEELKKRLVSLMPAGAFQLMNPAVLDEPLEDPNPFAAPAGNRDVASRGMASPSLKLTANDALLRFSGPLQDYMLPQGNPLHKDASGSQGLLAGQYGMNADSGLFSGSFQPLLSMAFMPAANTASKGALADNFFTPLDMAGVGNMLTYGHQLSSVPGLPLAHANFAANLSILQPAMPFAAIPWSPVTGNQNLADRIQWMEKTGISSMRLNLNPPQLGNLQVLVTVNDANQGAHIQFIASNPQMVQTLTNHFADLRDQLASFGFNNMSFDVAHRQGDDSQEGFRAPQQHNLYQFDDEAEMPIGRVITARNGRIDDYA